MDEQQKPQTQAEREPSEEQAKESPAKKRYEPPSIIQTQNVRDLVAGGVGSRPDARGRATFS